MQQFKAFMSGLNLPPQFTGIFEQMLAGCPPAPVQNPVIATAQPPKSLAEEEAAVEEATRQSRVAAEAHAQQVQAAANADAAAKAARAKEEEAAAIAKEKADKEKTAAETAAASNDAEAKNNKERSTPY